MRRAAPPPRSAGRSVNGGWSFKSWRLEGRLEQDNRQALEHALAEVAEIERLEDPNPVGEEKFDMRWGAGQRLLAARIAAKLYRRGLSSFVRACVALVIEELIRDPNGTVGRLARLSDRQQG